MGDMGEAMTGYQAIYKCRLCGEIYNGAFTGSKNIAISTAVCACLGIKSQEPQAPHLTKCIIAKVEI